MCGLGSWWGGLVKQGKSQAAPPASQQVREPQIQSRQGPASDPIKITVEFKNNGFTRRVSRGACRDTVHPPGPAEVASTRGPEGEWCQVPPPRHRRRDGPKPKINVSCGTNAVPKPARNSAPKCSPASPRDAPKPVNRGSRETKPRERNIPDMRPLPLPEPFDKHKPHPSSNQRHRDEWSW